MDSSQQQNERITAYLDGELSVEESAQVEQQLASDPQFRRALQGAERTWAALAQLPMATVGDEFSRTTLALVVEGARQDIEAQTVALPAQRRKTRTKTLVLGAVALLLSLWAARVFWNYPNRVLLADLPVIQNVDLYSYFDEVQFLRDLDRASGKRDSLGTPQTVSSRSEYQLVVPAAERQQWLEELSEDAKVSLRAKLRRFENLSAQQQSELRQLHQDLEAADDREALRSTLFLFQQWLSGLTPSEQYEVRKLPPQERALVVAQEMRQAESLQQLELTGPQLQSLFAQVRPQVAELVAEHQLAFDKYLSRRSGREKKSTRATSEAEQSRRALQFALLQSPDRARELVETIAAALPEDARDVFLELSERDKKEQLQAWIRQWSLAGRDQRSLDQVSEEELATFFAEELDSGMQEHLLALPRADMQNQLHRLYLGRLPTPQRLGRPRRGGLSPHGFGPPPAEHLEGPRHEGPWRDGSRSRRRPPPRGPEDDPRHEEK